MTNLIPPGIKAGRPQRLRGAIHIFFFLNRPHDRNIPPNKLIARHFRGVAEVPIGAARADLVLLVKRIEPG